MTSPRKVCSTYWSATEVATEEPHGQPQIVRGTLLSCRLAVLPMSARPWGQQRRLAAGPGSKSQGDSRRVDSIRAYVVRALLAEQAFDVLIDDDRAGETADLVGLRIDGNDLIITLVHCKFSTSDTPRRERRGPVRRVRSSNTGRPRPPSRGRGRVQVGVLRAVFERGWVGISCLVVRPRARRRGVGRALTLAALELAADIGADRAFLQVEASNDAAATLYRELGFRVMDRYHYRERQSDGQELRTVVDRASSTASCQSVR